MQGVKKCIVCGQEFYASRATCLCCSDPCRKERNRQKAYEAWQRYMAEKRYADRAKKPNAEGAGETATQGIRPGMSLAEVEAAAREAKMTYGQYVQYREQMGL